MITKISFKNYKSFKEEQELEIKPLTILIGKNSSGKSAVAKLPTMLESSLSGKISEPLLLDNNGVELGAEFRDLIYGRTPVGAIEFKISNSNQTIETKIAASAKGNNFPQIVSWKMGDNYNLIFNSQNQKYYNEVDDNEYSCDFSGLLLDIVIPELSEIPNQNKFKFSTEYIGPYRSIPERNYPNPKKREIYKVGFDGRGAYDVLINDSITLESTLCRNVSDWYKSVFDGWGLKIEKNPTQPDFYFEIFRDNPNLNINLKDVGQGMSQILPLVTRSYMAEKENVLIIMEEPELHLHPSAHGDLAERFVDSLKDKKKNYLIETHSQNFVLRIRRLVADGTLNLNDLAIYYVNYEEELGASKLERIVVDNLGEVDNWPEDVFNESLGEAMAIRRAQKVRK
ncbi:MAG: DUF3696 domain-containing protein [Salinivirgaceae bacterium]